MIPDDPELRRALDDRSARPSDEYRARLRHAFTSGRRTSASSGWMAATAVAVVILLTATSVGVVVAYRHANHGGVTSGTRTPGPSAIPSETRAVVSAPSDQLVWVLVEPGHLYRSLDGGNHWESKPLPVDVGIRPSISFIDASEGWLLAPGSPATQCQEAIAEVWHTTDAGKTWHRLAATGIGAAQCKELIYFADPQHGFVTAWDQNHRPAVYATRDGGLSWRKSALPDGPLFVTQGGGFTLRVGWIRSFGGTIYLEASGAQDDASWRQRAFIFTSTDGGATWVWKQKLASGYTFMVTESRWLQLAPDVEETVNGGQQFHPFGSDFRVQTPRAVFGSAEVGYATDGGNVLRSLDGGAKWAPITPGNPLPQPTPSETPIPMPTNATVDAVSQDVVWVLVADDHLYRSLDRGINWERRPMPPQPGRSFSFIDANEGWFLEQGSPATQCQAELSPIWHTTDGGTTWHELKTSGISESQCKDNLTFSDPLHGYLTASDPNHRPTIYQTVDGGKIWRRSTLPDPPGFVSGDSGFTLAPGPVYALGSTLLIKALGQNTASQFFVFVFRSADGGASWTSIRELETQYTYFVTATRWLSLDARLSETLDAGKTWHSFVSDYSQAAPIGPQMMFADASVGYATVRGDLKRTDDGGAHWVELATPGTATSPEIPAGADAQLSAPSANVVWALVANQVLFRSTDQGKIWQRREFPAYAGSQGGGVTMISFLDAKRGWAMFEGTPTGTCEQATVSVWRTSDGAATWQQLAHNYGKPNVDSGGLPLAQCKNYMAFVDGSHGFIDAFDINHRPTLLRTSDGGATWSGSTMPDVGGGIGYALVDIKAFDRTVIAVGGRSATLYFFRSTDGGASWTYTPGRQPITPSYLSLLTPTHWVMVQAGSQTSDGGKTWRPFNTDLPEEAIGAQFAFANETVGYATNGGMIFLTVDGGVHWSKIKTSWP